MQSGGHRDSDSGIRDLEDFTMHRSYRFIASLFLVAAIAAPVSTMAAPAPQQASVQVRVYDRDHKDYHNWDDNEDRAYRGYLTEQHITYREYNKQNRKTQRGYWNWRHEHPDHN
jgi:heat shock protein HspQ